MAFDALLLHGWCGLGLRYAPAMGQSETDRLSCGATSLNPSQGKRPIAARLAAERRTTANCRFFVGHRD